MFQMFIGLRCMMQAPALKIKLKGMLLNGLLMKLVMACECEWYANRLPKSLLLPSLMMLLFHPTSLLSRIYVRRSYH
ncbi:hypothetical protein A249_40901 [Pseudomonas syringae pv. actinidiae ICMP 18804]|uniref:Uncharacterized protein n=2 Tax=Pseudomonas syringae pv. actinidiae TaxID=103796 RepID=A0A656JJJ4_PSESF|nr:hypothetical protein A246_13686 [Pseudomonas syringae pv. actinidiae ICMP 19098]EPM65738.1 hypothetical protein A249_40901 [Pseudomonas syringae pv. actinidiae ICMP 18804]EPN14390.1 hypothetical protein A248_26962 [Pseudomonas syringae pv. actinidiae ICMP 19100]EPN22559.1 hypothetical protein A247_27981 [Pseudomonas syringae pv. actinidiae ICMP 19099]EPN30398.1 hypothetical protein A245_45583 [Pseudomonas syringae pv. actinidiae ICMP 19096]EPN34123.1 hypothetical protein A243_13894 [Pseudom